MIGQEMESFSYAYVYVEEELKNDFLRSRIIYNLPYLHCKTKQTMFLSSNFSDRFFSRISNYFLLDVRRKIDFVLHGKHGPFASSRSSSRELFLFPQWAASFARIRTLIQSSQPENHSSTKLQRDTIVLYRR